MRRAEHGHVAARAYRPLARPHAVGAEPTAWRQYLAPGARVRDPTARMTIPFNRPETRSKLFGGEGAVRVENLHGTLCAPFTAALHCDLSPGGSVGRHVQSDDDEIVIALAGDAVAYVNGAPRAMVPGAVVALPRGATLEIVNASVTDPFDYLIIKARAPR